MADLVIQSEGEGEVGMAESGSVGVGWLGLPEGQRGFPALAEDSVCLGALTDYPQANRRARRASRPAAASARSVLSLAEKFCWSMLLRCCLALSGAVKPVERSQQQAVAVLALLAENGPIRNPNVGLSALTTCPFSL